MDRLIRVGVPASAVLARRTGMALRYIKNKDNNLKFTSCKVKINDRFPYRALLNDLVQGHIDLAVVEYEKLLKEDYKIILNNLTVALVLPQGDTRDVLITRRKFHNHFDFAVVECCSNASAEYIKNMYDGVSCKDVCGATGVEIKRLQSGQCDAVVLPADYVRILNLDRVRGLKYNYFRNTYDDLNVKAVWVVMARKDDNALLNPLMSLSDVDTLQRIANMNQIV